MYEYEVFLNLIHFLQVARSVKNVKPALSVKRKLRVKASRLAPGVVRLNPHAPWLAQARQAIK